MARIHTPGLLRWSDMDAYGHINNVQLLRVLEEVRVRVFWPDREAIAEGLPTEPTAVIDGERGDTLTVIARQEIEYLQSIDYTRKPLDVQLWVSALGGASMDICYEVFTPVGVTPELMLARALTTIVMVDAATMLPRRLRPEEREAWEPYLGEPIAFRRR